MRILWLHQYFATPKGWGAVRTYEFARRFCSAGHAVDVVCSAGYDETLKGGCAPVLVSGIRVYVSAVGYKPHMGFLRRVVSFLGFMADALWHVLKRGGQYDAVIASSGPLTLAVPALACRWLRRVPYVFEVIDVWPDSAIAAGVLRSPVLKGLSFWLESAAYRHAAAIVTCSTGMTERVQRKLGAMRGGRCSADGKEESSGRQKVATISNCCDLEQFVMDGAKRREVRERLSVRSDQTIVLYTGAMGRSNEVSDLVEAVRATLRDERIVWWFAGDGCSAGELKEMEAGGTCRFFGKLAKEHVVDLYLAADLNVVTFMHEPLFYENSPNKFFDGIAAGLPAVFNRTTWLEPWLKEYDCGVVCAGPEPGREMAEAVRRLAADPERRTRMGRNARRLAEAVFDRDKLAGEYLVVLEEARKCERSKVGVR